MVMNSTKFLSLYGQALVLAFLIYLFVQTPFAVIERSALTPLPTTMVALKQILITSTLAVFWFYWVVRLPWYKRHRFWIGLAAYVAMCCITVLIIATELYQFGWTKFPAILFLTCWALRYYMYNRKLTRKIGPPLKWLGNKWLRKK